MITATFLFVSLLLGWALTGGVRRYAMARSVLDVPNARSSHTVPTPRGGGLAIALTTLAGVLAAWKVGLLAPGVAAALAGGGAMIAFVGWVDDHGEVPARVRAAVHLAASAWSIWCLGGAGSLRIFNGTLHLGPLGPVVGVIAIAWCINFYNFMDGIDGIAGVEAVVGGSVGAAVLLLAGQRGPAAVALVIAAASAGFLMWNWAPAKIFMGDVGSGLLGFLFGTLAFATSVNGSVPLVSWCLLLGVFVFAASVTLVRRMFRGERWYSAHHHHAYQRAVQVSRSHARVSASVLAINVVLAGLVLLGVTRPATLVPGTLAGIALLAAVYLLVERIRPMP